MECNHIYPFQISCITAQKGHYVKRGNLTISTQTMKKKPRQRHGYGQAAGDDKGGMGTHVNDCGSDTSTRPEGVNVGSSVEESKFPSLSKSLKLLLRSRNLQHHFGQRSFSDATCNTRRTDETHVKEGGNVTPLSDVILLSFR
jgi:hypothetical protein